MAFELHIDDVPDEDVARFIRLALRRTGDQFPRGVNMPDGSPGKGSVTDAYGNVIGGWTFIPEEET